MFSTRPLDYANPACFKLCGQMVDLLHGEPLSPQVSWQDNGFCECRFTSKEMTENKSIRASSRSSSIIVRSCKRNCRNVTTYPCYFPTPDVITSFVSRYRVYALCLENSAGFSTDQQRPAANKTCVKITKNFIAGEDRERTYKKRGRVSSEQIRSKKRPSGRRIPNNRQKPLNRSVE